MDDQKVLLLITKRKQKKLVSIVNDVSKIYQDLKLTNKRIKNGSLKMIIEEAKLKYGLPKECNIPIKTIQSRYRRNRPIVSHRGTVFPMEKIEPALLQIVIQKGKMNQPLSVNEGLQLANSMIKVGSQTEKNVIAYLKGRKQYSLEGSSTKNPGNLLGTGYWAGFRRRYNHLLVSKKGVQFGHNRSEWCMYDNFESMYKLVYEAMHTAGVVQKLEVPEWQDGNGDRVHCQSDSEGEKVEYNQEQHFLPVLSNGHHW